MFAIDGLIVAGAILLLFAIASSKFSSRAGLPVLVVFIALGMLAGSEGIGGLAFEDYVVAHAIGTVALVLILFDGGLRTSTDALRSVWKPAFTLATLGVTSTAVITGLTAVWVLDLPLLEGILLGSIVGSTDAAAVFSVLRSKGVRLSPRLASTLEVESGSNDPMAIFLTVGLLEVLTQGVPFGLSLVVLFVQQMVLGLVGGIVFGRLATFTNQRLHLEAAGLYPLLIGTFAFLAYGVTASVGGSGFLAAYVAGIVIGNSKIVFQRGILLFSDGMAWLGQIVMFTVLGLLVFPSRLLEVAGAGLAIAGVLILIARPIAVVPLLLPFGYNWREHVLIAWVGLRGAVPVILATFPLLAGLPSAPLIFDVVFFVVLISATLQGWSLPWVAEKLGLQRPLDPEAPITLEISSLRGVDGDIIDYLVHERSKAAGHAIRDLSLPEGAVVALVARGNHVIPPRGSTRVEPGDHVFVVLRPEVRKFVDRAFAGRGEEPEPLPALEFPLSGRTRVADLVEFYGIAVDAPPERTLAELMTERCERVEVGASLLMGGVRFTIRDIADGRIHRVGLRIEDGT